MKKFHYLLILFSYLFLIFHFIFVDYEQKYRITGIIFFTAAALIYAGFVYLFFKNETGKKVVGAGMIVIALFALFQVFTIG